MITVICTLLLIISSQCVTVQSDTLTPHDIEKSKDYSIFASVAACPKECI